MGIVTRPNNENIWGLIDSGYRVTILINFFLNTLCKALIRLWVKYMSSIIIIITIKTII